MTLCCRSQSFSVVSSSGLEMESPALLTTTVDAPRPGRASLTGGGDLCFVGDVGLHTDGDVGAAEFRGDGLSVLQAQVRDDHARAVGGEAGGDRLANARRRPGHQGDPANVDFGLGIRASLASSRAQYSIRNFSDSSIGA